jgi:fructose-1,6-bisphosphatase I
LIGRSPDFSRAMISTANASCTNGWRNLMSNAGPFPSLDGSSDTDANGVVGAIFAVPAGSEQVAARYVMYGPSTLLIYTSCAGVNGFTLDPGLGEFLLSHVELRCSVRRNYFSANLGQLGDLF